MNDPTQALKAVRREIPLAMREALQQQFGKRFSVAESIREHHGRDESPFLPVPPDAVVFAENAEEVSAVVKQCAQHKVPLIPFAVGSSLEGHLLAVQGGVSLDLNAMNKVLSINPEDLTATVQPAVTRTQLNDALRDTGLFFPIDPGADASIGGMAATRASGTNAVRYGTMRENVLGLKVVSPDGRIIQTGTRAKKSSAGYDLTRLFVGSEGTLGVITEVTVRLYPQPEAVSAAIVSFPNDKAAVDTVIQTIQIGVPIARSEYLDANAIKAINQHSKMELREQATLFFEFHGSEAGVQEQVELVQELARDNGGQDFEWATRPEDRSRLWNARHNFYFAALQMRPGSRAISTDTCVPISRLADSLVGAQNILSRSKTPTMIVGHVGDGNFHCAILLDPNNPDEVAAAESMNDDIVNLAIEMDGTCTGEHGIGLHKIKFLKQEAGEDAISLMRSIKMALDPDNIMNPGKIFELS